MKLRVALGQIACVLNDVRANLDQMVRIIEQVRAQADLVIFPELATTGYNLGDRTAALAEPVPGPATDRLARAAAEAGVHVVTGIIEKHPADGKPYNSSVWIDPRRGVSHVYRKVHLFGGEKELFTPGDHPAILDTPFGRIALTICYDMCFPEYYRLLALEGVQVILNSTNWFGNEYTDPWGWSGQQVRAMAMTRALENGLFVVMACRAGEEAGWRSFGFSTVAGPSGRLEAGLEAEPGVLTATIDLAQIDPWRRASNYLPDRRVELYGRIHERKSSLSGT